MAGLDRITVNDAEVDIRGKVSRDGNLYDIIRIGNSVFSEDARGYIPFSTVAEFLQFSQMTALSDPRFNISKARDEGHELFAVYMELEISLELYRKRKLDPIYCPMKFSTFVYSVGKSTANLVTVMRNPTNHKPLAYSFSSMVRASFIKGKSVPIPQEITDKLKVSDVNLSRRERLFSYNTQPRNAFRYSTLIRVSDIELHQTTNYTSYSTFCIDALVAASGQGKLRSFNYEQAPWLVKKWKCNFLKESRAGEMLNVYLRQDDHQDEKMYFRIDREDGKLAFMCDAEFYLNDKVAEEKELLITSDNAEFLNPIHMNNSNPLLERDIIRWKQFTASKERDELTFMIPGPLKRLSNFKGFLDIVTVASQAISGSVVLMKYCGIEDQQPEIGGKFLIRTDYVFEKELYSKYRRHQLYQPLLLKSKIHFISPSSHGFETLLLDSKGGTCLARSYPRKVLYHRDTRKSVRNSEEIIQKFGKHYRKSSPDDRVKDVPPPDDCFLYSTTVRHSQLDFNRHLNHYEYIRMILDATVGASEAGKLNYFAGDGYSRNMKKLTLTHEREFMYGEVVFIRLWDEFSNANKLNVRVTSEDGKLAMFCRMEFYEKSALEAKL